MTIIQWKGGIEENKLIYRRKNTREKEDRGRSTTTGDINEGERAMDKALALADERGIQKPDNLGIYMDDVFGTIRKANLPRRPGLRPRPTSSDPAADFNQALNDVHPRVQFTREPEVDGKLAFLDVELTRLPNGRISTRLYRKPTATNVTQKPHSCQPPSLVQSTIKGEICRA